MTSGQQQAFLRFAAFLIMGLLSLISFASQGPLNKVWPGKVEPVKAQFLYFEDVESAFDLQTITELEHQSWNLTDLGNESFGFTDSQYWLHLDAQNTGDATGNFVVDISYPLLDDVTFYSLRKDGDRDSLQIGDAHPFYPRDIDHPSILYRFQLEPSERIELYIRVNTKGSMILPVSVWDEKRFFEVAAEEQKIHFFFYGLLTFLALINVAVFFTLRERLYFYYASAIIGYLLFFVTIRGYGQQIFSDAPDVTSRIFLVSMPFLALFSVLFAREFLRTKNHSPRYDVAMKAMVGFECFNLAVCAFLDYNTAVKLSAVGAILFFAVLFCAGPITWLKGRRAGIFFTVAWVPLTIGVFAVAGRSAGFLPNNFWTEYAMQIGSAIEAFILTLALADRLYREREDKIRAQAESLRIEKQRNATQMQLTQAMTRDAVTQLPNRNRFEWLLRNTLVERPNDHFIVGVSRVTRMEEITRTLGFAASERVLRKIAQLMNVEAAKLPGVVTSSNAQGQIEAAFQLAGDTFGVFIDQSISQDNLEHYLSILKKLTSPIEIDGLIIELQPSFGVALYPRHGNDPAQLIRNAHVGMEHSDHAPDQIGYYDESLDIYNEGRLTLMSDLREALKNNLTEMHYQPKFSISKNQVIGFEALIRWTHPKHGFIPPDEFIPLAEETGVINDLTLWAFERAVRDLKTLQSEGYTGIMAINISARDLTNNILKDQLGSILEKYDVKAESVFLELTETASMRDPKSGIRALRALADIGLKIAIDDFGKGYSSLSYLKKLPATEIKLDRSLIHDICSNESSRTIVKTSIDMIHNLGYSLVAEGVEDAATFDLLVELNCDHVQGYFLSRPMPFSIAQKWLQQYSKQPLAN